MVRGRERVLPLAQGLIRVEGGTEWTRTDSLGYFQFGPLRFLKDEPVYLGFSAPGIRPHRYRVHPGKMEHHLFAIPDSTFRHLGRLSDESFDESHGLALGRISGTSLHLELVPDNRMNAGDKDFYFDAQGKIRRIPSFTDSRFGTYLIRERSDRKSTRLNSSH